MNPDNMNFCQSCGMPLAQDSDFGREKNGEKNADYCHFCYENGQFTSDISMEEMIEFCVPLVSKGQPYPDEQSARKGMQEFFPKLKRWQS